MALLRAATHEDALAISRVHVTGWQKTYRGILPDKYLDELDAEERVSRWQKHIESGTHLIVAESAGEIIGFINGGRLREPVENYDAELYSMDVKAEFQRKGIGTALVIAFAKSLYRTGFQSMLVLVIEANTAIRFYEKMGAIRVATRDLEIGGAMTPIALFGWPSLKTLAALGSL